MDRTTAVTGSAILEQPRSQELVSCEVGVTHARVSGSDVVVGSCVRSKQASSPVITHVPFLGRVVSTETRWYALVCETRVKLRAMPTLQKEKVDQLRKPARLVVKARVSTSYFAPQCRSLHIAKGNELLL